MTTRAKLTKERSAITGELSKLSRNGWSAATSHDWGPLEARLAKIDDALADLHVLDVKSGKVKTAAPELSRFLNSKWGR